MVRRIDIWLDTASSTGSGSVDANRSSRKARVPAVSSDNRAPTSRATAQASGHWVVYQLRIRCPTTL